MCREVIQIEGVSAVVALHEMGEVHWYEVAERFGEVESFAGQYPIVVRSNIQSLEQVKLNWIFLDMSVKRMFRPSCGKIP
jgi:hypothetical protein